MAQTSSFTIVESPLTSGKILTAMNLVRDAVATSGVPLLTSFNQGRSMMVGFTAGEHLLP